MLSNFKDFSREFLLEKLLNESVVYFSPKFSNILNSISDNKVAKRLLDIEMVDIKPDITFIDIGAEGYISFNTMKNALNKISGDYDHLEFIKDSPDDSNIEVRKSIINSIYNHSILSDIFKKSTNPLRIGKFVGKVLPNEFSSSEVEEFVNLFKSSIENSSERFSMVEGSDIAYWYNSKNYQQISGSLGKSCMADKKSEIFDIYVNNPGVCRMLVLFDDNKVIGRALVWKLSEIKSGAGIDFPPDLYFMDRQYTIKESDVDKFRKWANDNGWAYKTRNSHFDLQGVTYNGHEFNATMRVVVGSVPDIFPYADTFRRFDPSNKSLYNFYEESEEYEGDYLLDRIDGGWTEIQGGIWSEFEGRRISEDRAVWSDHVDSYLDIEESIEVIHGSRTNRGWYPVGHDALVYDEWNDITLHVDDAQWSEAYGYWVYSRDAVEVINSVDSDGEPSGARSNWYHIEDSEIINYGNSVGLKWFKRLSDNWPVWHDYEYALRSLFIDNWQGEKIIKLFAITVYKVLKGDSAGIDLVGEYLTDLDAGLLGCSIDRESIRVIDKFEYYSNIEQVLPELYSRANSELEVCDRSYIDELVNKISDIDDGIFVDSPG